MVDVVWSVPKRVAFRFGLIAVGLFAYPFPFGWVPKTEPVGEALSAPWEALVVWVAESVLGLGRPSTATTGSGDTTFGWVSMLVLVTLAAIGAAVWSVLDRKRLAYPKLAAGTVVVLRYVLAFTMLSYGFAKIVNTQFPSPTPIRLDARIGETSPMGLLWTFMGYSTPYTVFAGVLEAIAGVLLLFRRTATLGSLVMIAVMTNVAMLNLCYDVPVKLYSLQLLVLAGALALPHARRILAAILGYATPAVPDLPRMAPRGYRIRLVIKAFALCVLAFTTILNVHSAVEFRYAPTSELYGTWLVESWAVDGLERPPLTTDKERWRRLLVARGGAAIRLMTDERLRVGFTVDSNLRTVNVKSGEQSDTLTYARSDADHLVLDGKWAGKRLHVTLTREPEPLLVTRKFSWVQEYPFNR